MLRIRLQFPRPQGCNRADAPRGRLAEHLGGRPGNREERGPRRLAPPVGDYLSQVEAEGFSEQPDGSISVAVRQVVHDAQTAQLLSDSRLRHRFWLEDGLIVRMEVLEPERLAAKSPRSEPAPGFIGWEIELAGRSGEMGGDHGLDRDFAAFPSRPLRTSSACRSSRRQ